LTGKNNQQLISPTTASAESEIGQFDVEIMVEQNVFALNVSMSDLKTMNVLDRCHEF
jgi:hypothetical protein